MSVSKGTDGSEKDYELLDPGRSPNRSDSILERIERLNREISRGKEVYSEDELVRLQRMLDDYLSLLHGLTLP